VRHVKDNRLFPRGFDKSTASADVFRENLYLPLLDRPIWLLLVLDAHGQALAAAILGTA